MIMSIAEMKKAIIAKIDTFSEPELEQLLKSIDSRPEKGMDINEYIRANNKRVIEENLSLLKRLAQ